MMSFRPALTLTMNNAQTVLNAGLHAIAGGQSSIDLADVTVVDSAAVATLLAWQRAARKSGNPLEFQNIPANLQSLLTLYGVDAVLHSSSGTSGHVSRSDLPHH